MFDTSAIVYTFGLFILLHLIPWNLRNTSGYQAFLKVYFVIVITACILVNIIDTGYYPFSGRRSGMELFAIKNDIADQAFSYLLSYWYLLIAVIAVVWMSYKMYPHLDAPRPLVKKQLVAELLLLPVVAAACFLGARGGTHMRPIAAFDAARFADVKLVNLTLNTPFQMLISVQQTGVEEKHYFQDEIARQYFNPLHSSPVFSPAAPGTPPPNIVLIIVESLGKEYVGYYNGGKGYTPFLDSLFSHSKVFMHAYANGKRSIEGIPSIIASMPSLMNNDYSNSIYQSNKLRGIGDYLSQSGYDASFYHGGKNGTMSFDNFIAITNSGKYYGMNEYPDKERDYDGDWGIYDEPYLSYLAKELGHKKRPFFSTVFTLSSHHPYNIPAHLKGKFSEGSLPIHKTIRYADYALQQFFESIKNEDWYQNTCFIITADHSAENEIPYFQTSQGIYEIPMAVFVPGKNLSAKDAEMRTFQQTDILPLILSMSSYRSPYFSFSSGKEGFAVQYFNKIYQLIEWPYVYHFDGEKGIGYYNLRSDPAMDHSLITSGTDDTKIRMDSMIKSVIQQYNQALIDNKTISE